MSIARKLDQFFTNPNYAKEFINIIDTKLGLSNYKLIVEPSAGSGSFLFNLDKSKRIGLDIDPKFDEIIEQDYLTWNYPTNIKTITIGNPPFGKNSSLAVKFFNYSAQFSDAIAFILPRTFRKPSVVNRLNKHFHLIYDEIVPDNSFIFNGESFNATCCAQIWVKKDIMRNKISTYKIHQLNEYFEIVDNDKCDFSVRRVGVYAGNIKTSNYSYLSRNSNYFIKSHKEFVLDVFKKIDFNKVKSNTAGNPSISLNELVMLFIETANELNYNVSLKE
jgi:hypothetical protein